MYELFPVLIFNNYLRQELVLFSFSIDQEETEMPETCLRATRPEVTKQE